MFVTHAIDRAGQDADRVSEEYRWLPRPTQKLASEEHLGAQEEDIKAQQREGGALGDDAVLQGRLEEQYASLGKYLFSACDFCLENVVQSRINVTSKCIIEFCS